MIDLNSIPPTIANIITQQDIKNGGFITTTTTENSTTYEICKINNSGNRIYIVVIQTPKGIYSHQVEIKNFYTVRDRNIEIKRLHDKCNLSAKFLSKIFGVSKSTISTVINQKIKKI